MILTTKRKATHKIKKRITTTMLIRMKIIACMLTMKSRTEIHLSLITIMRLVMMTNQWRSSHSRLESLKMVKI